MQTGPSGLERRVIAAVLLLFTSLVLIRIFTERPLGDEAYFATPALNLIRNGYMGASNIDPTNPIQIGIDRHSYWTVPVYFLINAAWYKVVGFDLFRARIVPLLFSIAGLIGMYYAARKLTDSVAIGLVTSALMGLTYPYIWCAAINRMDSACLAFGIAGLAFYLWNRERSFAKAICISNALVAASGLTHPAGILYFIALCLLTLYYDRGRIRFQHLVFASVPYLAGGLAWWMYLKDAPQEFIAQFMGSVNYHRLKILSIANLKAEVLSRYLGYFGLYGASGAVRLRSLQLIVYVGAIMGAVTAPAISQKKGTRPALILLLTMCVGLAIIDGIKSRIYLIHVIPWFSLVLAIVAVRLMEAKIVSRPLVIAVVSVPVLIQVAGILFVARENSLRTKFLPVVSYLQANAPEPQTIFGSSELGFYIGFGPRLMDDPSLGYWSGKSADVIVADTNWTGTHWPTYKPGDGQYERHEKVLSGCRISFQTDDYKLFRCSAQ